MITIESQETMYAGPNHSPGMGQMFVILVPDEDVIEMDFTEEERALIRRAQENESVFSALKVLLMIVAKGAKNG